MSVIVLRHGAIAEFLNDIGFSSFSPLQPGAVDAESTPPVLAKTNAAAANSFITTCKPASTPKSPDGLKARPAGVAVGKGLPQAMRGNGAAWASTLRHTGCCWLQLMTLSACFLLQGHCLLHDSGGNKEALAAVMHGHSVLLVAHGPFRAHKCLWRFRTLSSAAPQAQGLLLAMGGNKDALASMLQAHRVLLAAHGPYTAAGIGETLGLPVDCVSKDFSSFDGESGV